MTKKMRCPCDELCAVASEVTIDMYQHYHTDKWVVDGLVTTILSLGMSL